MYVGADRARGLDLDIVRRRGRARRNVAREQRAGVVFDPAKRNGGTDACLAILGVGIRLGDLRVGVARVDEKVAIDVEGCSCAHPGHVVVVGN